MTYQQQYVLDGAAGRDAILNLTVQHKRCYSEGDSDGWIATFRHSGPDSPATVKNSPT